MCCYIDEQPADYGVDIFPILCHKNQIDMRKTTRNVQRICRCFGFPDECVLGVQSLVLWRVGRVSKLFSGALRHQQDQARDRDQDCPSVQATHDGPAELHQLINAHRPTWATIAHDIAPSNRRPDRLAYYGARKRAPHSGQAVATLISTATRRLRPVHQQFQSTDHDQREGD